MYDAADFSAAVPAKHEPAMAIHRSRRLPHVGLQAMADTSIAHSAVERLANSTAGRSGATGGATRQAETRFGQLAQAGRRLVGAFQYP